ncbi:MULTISPECIES: hypothetical protein [Pseudomonas]|uniref:Glycine-rich domain-containing protein-like n=1 Tax=Pseudomonas kielensis TaxID=2762577 RepID=A0A7X1KXB3_9PSED|nr:hypothetical protein [Pseudomonas kielensis]
MTQQFDNAVFEQALALTATWDFKLAIEKVLEIKNGEWTRDRAEKAVQNYTRYMAVTKALGGLQMVPNGDIDEIWHMHILDTRAYMADCNALFGEYLHHYPYFGMLGEENRQQWLQVQKVSTNLWVQLFGEPLYGADSAAQKCPQVCPCNIDDLTITSSGLSDVLRSA